MPSRQVNTIDPASLVRAAMFGPEIDQRVELCPPKLYDEPELKIVATPSAPEPTATETDGGVVSAASAVGAAIAAAASSALGARTRDERDTGELLMMGVKIGASDRYAP